MARPATSVGRPDTDAGTVEALLADEEKLAAILTYVVGARVNAGDIVTANGASPRPSTAARSPRSCAMARVYVNGTQATTADIVASNGVIHVIDTVLLPPAPTAGGQ